ncbi:MAG: hypothetical protein AAGG75_14125 [Bacteroidota bacterium]
MEKTPYRRVSCDFYDSLEALATRRQALWIEYRDEAGQLQDCQTTLADLQARQGAEYALLSNGLRLRLDQITRLREIEWLL